MAVATPASSINLEALDGFRDKLKLTWEDIAATIGVDNATLFRWRKEATTPRGIYRGRLQQLEELSDLLRQLFAGPDLAREWLHTALPESLGGHVTPLEVMRTGRIDRVVMLLYALARGA